MQDQGLDGPTELPLFTKAQATMLATAAAPIPNKGISGDCSKLLSS